MLRTVCWSALVTFVMSMTTLNVELDPDRPTQLYRAPSADGSSAWIITASDDSSKRPTAPQTPQRHRPSSSYHSSSGYQKRRPSPWAVDASENEIRGSSGTSSGSSSGNKFLPTSFVVTSRPFGLGAGGSGSPPQRPVEHQHYQEPSRPTYVDLGAVEARPSSTSSKDSGSPDTAQSQSQTSVESPDGVAEVGGQKIPTYNLGCKEGKKCSFIISVPTRQPEPNYTAYDLDAVQAFLNRYRDILTKNPNRTSSYLIQKMEPKKRFPSPMDAYQRDQLKPAGPVAAPSLETADTPSIIASPVRRRPAQSPYSGSLISNQKLSSMRPASQTSSSGQNNRWSSFYNLFSPLWSGSSQRRPAGSPYDLNSAASVLNSRPRPPYYQDDYRGSLGGKDGSGAYAQTLKLRPGTSGYYNSIPSPYSANGARPSLVLFGDEAGRTSARSYSRGDGRSGRVLFRSAAQNTHTAAGSAPEQNTPKWSKFSVERQTVGGEDLASAHLPTTKTIKPTGQIFKVHLSSGPISIKPEPGEDFRRENRRTDKIEPIVSIVTDEGEVRFPNVLYK